MSLLKSISFLASFINSAAAAQITFNPRYPNINNSGWVTEQKISIYPFILLGVCFIILLSVVIVFAKRNVFFPEQPLGTDVIQIEEELPKYSRYDTRLGVNMGYIDDSTPLDFPPILEYQDPHDDSIVSPHNQITE
jgi:hypothetical protein